MKLAVDYPQRFSFIRDYRGLKKRITAIRIAQENDDTSSHNSVPPAPPLLSTSQIQTTTVADGEPSQPRARSFLAEIVHEEDEHDSVSAA